jgi:hypothetical protein
MAEFSTTLVIFNGGEGGIRTHGTVAGTPVFETSQFNRSCTSPNRENYTSLKAIWSLILALCPFSQTG